MKTNQICINIETIKIGINKDDWEYLVAFSEFTKISPGRLISKILTRFVKVTKPAAPF